MDNALGFVNDVKVDADGKVVGDKTYYGKETTDTEYILTNVPKSDYKVFLVAFDKYGNKTWGWKVSHYR